MKRSGPRKDKTGTLSFAMVGRVSFSYRKMGQHVQYVLSHLGEKDSRTRASKHCHHHSDGMYSLLRPEYAGKSGSRASSSQDSPPVADTPELGVVRLAELLGWRHIRLPERGGSRDQTRARGQATPDHVRPATVPRSRSLLTPLQPLLLSVSPGRTQPGRAGKKTREAYPSAGGAVPGKPPSRDVVKSITTSPHVAPSMGNGGGPSSYSWFAR